jgi:hypothetical protein
MRLKNFKCLLLVALLATALAGRASAQFPSTHYRIMTLGDSITEGFLYQKFLREKLVTEGANYTFVGSRGTIPNKHQGWSGIGVNGISNNVNTWLTSAFPDSNANVVMLQVGINDIGHGQGIYGSSILPPYINDPAARSEGPRIGETLANIAYQSDLYQSVPALLDKILDHSTAPTLIVAKIPGLGKGYASKWPTEYKDADSRISEYNAILEKEVKARQDNGKKIRLINNNALGSREFGTGPDNIWGPETRQTGPSSDWVHPDGNSAGYERMGTNFFNGLKDALGVPASTLVDHTLETPVAITARGFDINNGVAHAFDNKRDTIWYDPATDATWLQFEFASPRIVNRYVMTSGNLLAHDPMNWTLQGSNGGTFVDLNSQTGQSFEWRHFPKMYKVTNSSGITNNTAYKYYRLNITANKSTTTATQTGTQVSELRLWGPTTSTTGTDIPISNAGFEDVSNTVQKPAGWTTWANTTANEAADYADSQRPKSGNYRLSHWLPNSAYQVYTYRVITGLTNGSYTLKAWTMSSGGQTNAALVVKRGGTTLTTNIPQGSSWTQQALPFTISDVPSGQTGQAEIGFWSNASHTSAGQWITVDDVTLTRN